MTLAAVSGRLARVACLAVAAVAVVLYCAPLEITRTIDAAGAASWGGHAYALRIDDRATDFHDVQLVLADAPVHDLFDARLRVEQQSSLHLAGLSRMTLVTALGQDRADMLLEESNAFFRQRSGLLGNFPGRGDAREVQG